MNTALRFRNGLLPLIPTLAVQLRYHSGCKSRTTSCQNSERNFPISFHTPVGTPFNLCPPAEFAHIHKDLTELLLEGSHSKDIRLRMLIKQSVLQSGNTLNSRATARSSVKYVKKGNAKIAKMFGEFEQLGFCVSYCSNCEDTQNADPDNSQRVPAPAGKGYAPVVFVIVTIREGRDCHPQQN